MKKKLLTPILLLLSLFLNAQNDNFWKKINSKDISTLDKKKEQKGVENPILFQLDEVGLKKTLMQINDQTALEAVEISMPNADGIIEHYNVRESSNFAPELQAKYPEIRSYKGIGLTDHSATVYFSFSPKGVQTMVLRADKDSEFIESFSKTKAIYKLSTSKNSNSGNLPVACSTDDVVLSTLLQNKTSKIKANDKVFRTFRLALSCNAEYTNYYGGTVAAALAGMNASMTRINGIFGKELAVKFEIIAKNDLLIYLDPLSDPYSESTTGADNANGATWNLELQNNLTSILGNGGYDVGHLLSGSGGGGNAGCIGCICTNPTSQNPYGKGSGWSAPSNNTPEGPNFDIDVIAHEMGHQLGGNHTFTFKVEGRGANIEPGSGSTIMGYAGVVSPSTLNIQAHSDDYYSVNSVQQIQANLAFKSCSTNTPISNSPPIINAGLDYTIPKGTAFILKGVGSDPNGDTVSYTWEENDNAITQTDANSISFPTKVDGPLFRSIKPSSSPVRYMPLLKDVLANTLTTKWESVSNIERTLNFFLTGRDNAALGTTQTNSDDMNVAVSGTVGPFAVTSQNTDNIGWNPGGNQTITWSVNGSETLGGAANVNIKLSTDGGLTFPILLASNTPNDGSEAIIAPNISATNCRLLIEPTANIFYAVNSKVFAVGYSVTSECNTYTFSTPIAIPDNSLNYSTRTITVPSTSSTIVDVNVALAVKHTFMADVQIEVVSPQGTAVMIQDKSCGNSNINVIYDDSGSPINCGSTALQNVIPSKPLSVFNGQDPANTWTLKFRDISDGDTGTLNSASITICTKTFVSLSVDKLSLSNFALYPNPSKGQFNIQFSSQSDNDVTISIHDLLGRKVFKNKYNKTGSEFNENVQLKNVTSGVYLLTVEDGDRKEEKKIIID
ncbi:MAG: T9SS type A sorting domain-containing protein [Flavobacterium sp.]|nr:T9SS type A sorting domain-containing protein [Flavobacterium sp.]